MQDIQQSRLKTTMRQSLQSRLLEWKEENNDGQEGGRGVDFKIVKDYANKIKVIITCTNNFEVCFFIVWFC